MTGEIKLTVEGENVTRDPDATKGQDVDLKNRDPEALHDNLKVRFHDIFGEPDDSVYSFDAVWRLAFKVFTNTRLWCYRITSLICGIPAALYWGVYFAILSFCTIWCCEPYMKAYLMELRCVRRLFEISVNTFYRPCCEACGYIFYNIRVTKQ